MSQATPLPPKLDEVQPPYGQHFRPVSVAEAASSGRARLHPYSGALVLLVDNVCFGANVATLGIGTLFTSIAAFCVTGTGVFLTQRYLDKDSFGQSVAKAFLSGVLAGVPTSLAGTVFGSAVLLSSGLSALNKKRE